MGISSFPQKTGTDWSKYTPFSAYEIITPGASNVYETAYSITGKGYLSKAIVHDNDGISGDAYIKITVDGVEINETKSTNANDKICGISLENFVFSGSTGQRQILLSSLSRSINEPLVTHPKTNGEEAIILLAKPIFFNTSLLIEIKQTAGNDVEVVYSGGYIA